MDNKTLLFLPAFLLLLSACSVSKINRKEVVQRHNITLNETTHKPLQVGNGNFAFNVDITGLQTFAPHNTMAHWAFHSMPLPEGMKPEDFKGIVYNVNGRPVKFEIDNPQQPVLSKWLAANPHAANLGRIGLRLTHKDGSPATITDLKNPVQHLNLWTGVITSTFNFDGTEVEVKTACHPEKDEIGVQLRSLLISRGQLKLALDFPYGDVREFTEFVGDYNNPQKHTTKLQKMERHIFLQRTLDDLKYSVTIKSGNDIDYAREDSLKDPHKIVITPKSDFEAFTFHFSKEAVFNNSPMENVFDASAGGWKRYWLSGAAVDFSKCTDPRAFELERRIVTSQYLMKVNNAGSLPPAETGLLKNSWYGRFHFEMIWWHGVHFALWNRWKELDKMLDVYQKFLHTSIERARKQGYPGARWPKATANIDREWPHIIHALLIWQQPHPIYFAELDYRLHPTKQTLEKWKDVVLATAEFMAAYPVYDSAARQYNLDAPVFLVSENTKPDSTKNPAFELSYWRYGLRTAIEWRKRLQLPEAPTWNAVLENLAPLPVENNKYVTFEGIQNMWTKYNYEHPGLIATYGMLPGDGVDTTILRNTFNKVLKTWDFDRTWGWDFPVVAMTAARLNRPEIAIDMLLYQNKHNLYDSIGYNSWVYFPANGGLLTAIAMMAGGWDGGPGTYAPGFPKNGKWKVRVERFRKKQ